MEPSRRIALRRIVDIFPAWTLVLRVIGKPFWVIYIISNRSDPRTVVSINDWNVIHPWRRSAPIFHRLRNPQRCRVLFRHRRNWIQYPWLSRASKSQAEWNCLDYEAGPDSRVWFLSLKLLSLLLLLSFSLTLLWLSPIASFYLWLSWPYLLVFFQIFVHVYLPFAI